MNKRLGSRVLDLQGRDPGRGGLSSSGVFVGSVVSTPAPAVGQFMAVNPVSVLGSEAEGGSGVFATDSAVTVPVFLVGPGVPTAGDRLVCRFVDYRWVAERKGSTGGGGGTHFYDGCPCLTIPATLNVNVVAPDYDPLGGYPYIRPDVLTWQAPPADCPRAASYTGYWGATRFEFYPLRSVNPYVFRYYLRCVHGFYVLSYWYTEDSVISADTGFYDIFKWVVGFPGNSCSPFRLTTGTNSGDSSDTNSSRVTITS